MVTNVSVTIATSALFEQTTGMISDSVQLNHSLELRQTPHIRKRNERYPPNFNVDGRGVWGYDYVGETLIELFGNLTNNWLYSAVIEATLNGSEPQWSADGWSFIPVDLSELHGHKTSDNTKSLSTYGSLINVTLTTPAIRGRVECHQLEEIRNGSTTWVSNSTRVDSETNKTEPYIYPNLQAFGSLLTPDAKYLSCCTNNTDKSRNASTLAPMAIGFWTQQLGNASQYISGTTNNFTVKYIYGDATKPASDMSNAQVYFGEIPEIQAVRCMPVFETSEAEVVVDQQARKVLSYRLLEDPRVDDSAWTDAFVFHEPTDLEDPVLKQELKVSGDYCKNESASSVCYRYAMQNLTTRYDSYFTVDRILLISDTATVTYS